MGGRNGGAMGRNGRDSEALKKDNVVTMPLADGGENVEGVEKDEKKMSAKKALRHAVKEAVKKDCGELANKLMEKAKKGDLPCTEVLLGLMEKKKKKGGGDDGSDGASLAEQLMEGPTWEEVLEERRKAQEEEEEPAATGS